MNLQPDETRDIWGSIEWPRTFPNCPSCGIDRAEQIGTGHCAGCDYGSGENWAGAKERREKWRSL